MPQDESKHARRKARRRAEKAQMKRKIRELEKNAKLQDRLRKKKEEEITAQAERIEKLEKSIKRLEKTLYKQADRLDQHEDDLNRANLLHKTTVGSTILPIIAAILYKSIYQIGFGKSYQEQHFGDNRDERLRAKENEFLKFGLLSVEEMRLFADTWSTTITERNTAAHNTAAHTASGDDIIQVLPFASPGVALILERGFELIFGLHPTNWGHASVRQKLLRLSA